MIVLWSKHFGDKRDSAKRAIGYLLNKEVKKQLPDKSWKDYVRVPPPELLKGNPKLLQLAIETCQFQRKYSSCVLSFEANDIKVSDFNSHSGTARKFAREVMREFEDTAFAGIPRKRRPPFIWVAHTDKGRLELNFLTVRSIQCANGKIMSINPNPATDASWELWRAFRDKCNQKYGWADPEDPARARLFKSADHLEKIAAVAKGMGQITPASLSELFATNIIPLIHKGIVRCRNDVIKTLMLIGLRIPRIGRAYVTIELQNNRKRLRGAIFSELFTSPQAIGLNGKNQRILVKEEIEKRYQTRFKGIAAFNLKRYGGPDWSDEVSSKCEPGQYDNLDSYLRDVMDQKSYESVYGTSQDTGGKEKINGAYESGRLTSQGSQTQKRGISEPIDGYENQDRGVGAQAERDRARKEADDADRRLDEAVGKFNEAYQRHLLILSEQMYRAALQAHLLRRKELEEKKKTAEAQKTVTANHGNQIVIAKGASGNGNGTKAVNLTQAQIAAMRRKISDGR
ncbi:hypothetical protein MTBLM1_130011 [Rhodospirillaceae bacterium LM-1]|nr:hypothetical protein MTBLM1_130011 [Rhodospirillaceae bacterium LM-1]